MAPTYGNIRFITVDYVVLGIMLALSLAIGLYFTFIGNKDKTKEEYLLGNRRMPAFAVCVSLFASYQSAVTILGMPNEVYSYGTMFIYSLIGYSLASLLVMYTVVPLLYPLHLTSVYEYFALRYESKLVQKFAAAIGIIVGLSYMSVALVSPALALETTAGIPLWLSVVVIGGVCTIYTTLGGLKSVIWTDVIQALFMFIGTLTILIKGCIDAGGMNNVWKVNMDTGRIVLDEISIDPRVRHTVWNLSFGYVIFSCCPHVQQSSVQRILSTRSVQDAKKVHLFTIPLLSMFRSMLLTTGLVITAYFYVTRCDPMKAGYINNRNQMVPYFVLVAFRSLPGFAGLYISAIFSGALSTLSSGINSLAANTVEDFLSRFLRGKSEYTVTTVTKLIVCFYGCVAIGLAYVAKDFQGPMSQIIYTVLGPSGAVLLGLFVLSATFPQANRLGVVVGCLVGLMAGGWQAIGSSKFGSFTKVLPGAPTDGCLIENSTLSSIPIDYGLHTTSTENSILFNGTREWMLSEAMEMTTSKIVDSTQEVVDVSEHREFSMYDLSYIWIPVIGFLTTMVVGLITSIITNCFISNTPRPKADLMFPFCRRFWYSRNNVVPVEINLQSTDSVEG